ncbi:hypothetical protein PDE_05487 [Penicillium oxalicum 114-2]|uniref:Uncharacterized protein n=1 Tax=Penicillium oxalicum (strain 114-2 / CGMCC 5302) TaxID=933388 RepID=S7ZIS1_PENO1|nr:hypothetical protein PDE_05487 [Penicillium oxalicum 114-2]
MAFPPPTPSWLSTLYYPPPPPPPLSSVYSVLRYRVNLKLVAGIFFIRPESGSSVRISILFFPLASFRPVENGSPTFSVALIGGGTDGGFPPAPTLCEREEHNPIAAIASPWGWAGQIFQSAHRQRRAFLDRPKENDRARLM